MRIKVIYIKNLKMSEGKIASQCCHAVLGLNHDYSQIKKVVALGVSLNKFKELTEENTCYIQVDSGFTEVDSGTQTAAAWLEY